jgi:succinate dehydrogenase flavin-adding protein (antitoxin of CptAB toxin-antitoxin module)
MGDENLRKQLLYRSMHRGCKETDILLGGFAEIYINELSKQELEEYEKLLKADDADIYNWICEKEIIPKEYNLAILGRIREFNKTRRYGT